MMKRDKSIIKIFFSALSCMIALLLCGCPDMFTEYNKELHPLQTPADNKDARIIPPGTGNFILVIDGFKNGRTIMPVKPGSDDISEFKLVFSNSGVPIDPVILNKNEIGTPINLDIGNYTLTVLAYKDSANDPLPTATGVLTEIIIIEGQTITAAVKLDLYTINGGTGFFTISLSGALAYNLKINSLISGGTLVNENNPEAGYTLNSGYYLIVVTATNDSGNTAVRSDVLHIYNNLRSEKTYTFVASDFIPNLSGTVTISDCIIGAMLNASVTASNASGTFRYQWYKNGNPVGSNSNTYGPLSIAEIGDVITVRVIHNNRNGSITGDAVTVVPFLGSSPYQIKNETQLEYIAMQVNAGNTVYNTADYLVMNNITLTKNWTPIGTETNPFSGWFDGDGYMISNLTITGSALTGFFGSINNDCYIINLHLQIGSAGINGTNYTGGIAGKIKSAYIDSCSVSGGSVSTNNQDAGGIAGYVDSDGVIEYCYTTSNVISTAKNSGGIAGTLYMDASINNCYAAGTISGSGTVGGIAGDVFGGGTIENCVALNPAIIKMGNNINPLLGRISGHIDNSNAVNNKARSDMLVDGLPVTSGTFTNKNGQNVTVGTDTTLASVFADFDTTFWDIPSGNLVVNGALPTLKGSSEQNPTLPAAAVSPYAVTVRNEETGAITGYTTLNAALASISTAGTYTVTLLADQTMTATRSLSSYSYINLKIEGAGEMRTINSDISFFNVYISNCLTIGNNITIQGKNILSNDLIFVSNGTLIMEGNSIIKGYNISGASYAVIFVSGSETQGRFIMRGGTITGNNHTSTDSTEVGAVNISSTGYFEMSGGSITGNTQGTIASDVYSSVTNAERFTLSGSANIGSLKLNATGNTSFARVQIEDNFSGKVDKLHLRGNNTEMATAISYWVNNTILQGELISGTRRPITTDDVNRFTLGNFYSSAAGAAGQPISATHVLGTTGNDLGKLVGKPVYNIGDTGPAGGIVFYYNPSGFTVEGYGIPGDTGYFAPYTAYYLEAAPANEGSSIQWGGYANTIADVTTDANSVNIIADSIGVGRKDTQIIINYLATIDETGRAAQVCASKSLNSFTDWFLPSLGELNAMYEARTLLDISSGNFWSSSQSSIYDYAWFLNFDDGSKYGYGKDYEIYVRAIRAF